MPTETKRLRASIPWFLLVSDLASSVNSLALICFDHSTEGATAVLGKVRSRSVSPLAARTSGHPMAPVCLLSICSVLLSPVQALPPLLLNTARVSFSLQSFSSHG